jgi:hypothetical protein
VWHILEDLPVFMNETYGPGQKQQVQETAKRPFSGIEEIPKLDGQTPSAHSLMALPHVLPGTS